MVGLSASTLATFSEMRLVFCSVSQTLAAADDSGLMMRFCACLEFVWWCKLMTVLVLIAVRIVVTMARPELSTNVFLTHTGVVWVLCPRYQRTQHPNSC